VFFFKGGGALKASLELVEGGVLVKQGSTAILEPKLSALIEY